jgi:hypothetical protein
VEKKMSNQPSNERDDDGIADSMATVAIITIVVTVMYLWLSGMPS